MKLAIDFDGTIVEHKYPKIGKEIPFAFQTLKMLQEKEHLLILWTFRTGRYLDEAVEYCKQNGLEFYAINSSYPDQIMDETISRKIDCDLFIDDRNIGGLMPWGEVYQLLHPDDGDLNYEMPKKKNSFWKR